MQNDNAKPISISKQLVYDAFLRVKANRGSAGIALTMEKEQHIRVCNPLLQVDCEGPTLISYIVAKHLAHASRGTISHHRTCRSAYGGSYFGHHLR